MLGEYYAKNREEIDWAIEEAVTRVHQLNPLLLIYSGGVHHAIENFKAKTDDASGCEQPQIR